MNLFSLINMKVISSGGSTLLEQELDESRMTVTSVSPEISQTNR